MVHTYFNLWKWSNSYIMTLYYLERFFEETHHHNHHPPFFLARYHPISSSSYSCIQDGVWTSLEMATAATSPSCPLVTALNPQLDAALAASTFSLKPHSKGVNCLADPRCFAVWIQLRTNLNLKLRSHCKTYLPYTCNHSSFPNLPFDHHEPSPLNRHLKLLATTWPSSSPNSQRNLLPATITKVNPSPPILSCNLHQIHKVVNFIVDGCFFFITSSNLSFLDLVFIRFVFLISRI